MNVDFTGRRCHELALQNWLYDRFLIEDTGASVPVIFSSPTDAFANFNQLWNSDKNPFKYLLEIKDEQGRPVYTYPSNQIYPLISVHGKGWQYRANQSYSTKMCRRIHYPTVSADVTIDDLGTVRQAYYPSAWDFKFQLDHFCLQPGTQARFIHRLMEEFTRGGGNLQTWMLVRYPDWWSTQLIRMRLDGGIENMTEPAAETHTEFRTSCAIVVEGYVPDIDVKEIPTYWYNVFETSFPMAPGELEVLFSETEDVRPYKDSNEVFTSLYNLPPPSTRTPRTAVVTPVTGSDRITDENQNPITDEDGNVIIEN